MDRKEPNFALAAALQRIAELEEQTTPLTDSETAVGREMLLKSEVARLKAELEHCRDMYKRDCG